MIAVVMVEKVVCERVVGVALAVALMMVNIALVASVLDVDPTSIMAPLNIPAMLVTRDTSHLEMSALKDIA